MLCNQSAIRGIEAYIIEIRSVELADGTSELLSRDRLNKRIFVALFRCPFESGDVSVEVLHLQVNTYIEDQIKGPKDTCLPG